MRVTICRRSGSSDRFTKRISRPCESAAARNVTSDAISSAGISWARDLCRSKIDPATRTAQVANRNREIPDRCSRSECSLTWLSARWEQPKRPCRVASERCRQTINNQQVVFVATDKPTEFIMRPVRVGAEKQWFLSGAGRVDRRRARGGGGSFLLRAGG